MRLQNVRQGGGFGPKPETELLWLDLGCTTQTATGDGAWGWCDGAYEVVVVVGWCVRKMRGAERVGQKKPKRASVAWFQVAVGLQEVEGGAVGL